MNLSRIQVSFITKVSTFQTIGNFIPHEIAKSGPDHIREHEYFSENNQLIINPGCDNIPVKMKMLSPKVFDIKEQLSKKNFARQQQKRAKETLKYIAIYRKVIRNTKALSSSRTDLKQINTMNDSDLNIQSINNWSKNGYPDGNISNAAVYDQIVANIQPKQVPDERDVVKGHIKHKLGLPHLPKRSISESINDLNSPGSETGSTKRSITNRSGKRQFKSVVKNQPKLPTIERHLQQSHTFMKTLKMKSENKHDFIQGRFEFKSLL